MIVISHRAAYRTLLIQQTLLGVAAAFAAGASFPFLAEVVFYALLLGQACSTGAIASLLRDRRHASIFIGLSTILLLAAEVVNVWRDYAGAAAWWTGWLEHSVLLIWLPLSLSLMLCLGLAAMLRRSQPSEEVGNVFWKFGIWHVLVTMSLVACAMPLGGLWERVLHSQPGFTQGMLLFGQVAFFTPVAMWAWATTPRRAWRIALAAALLVGIGIITFQTLGPAGAFSISAWSGFNVIASACGYVLITLGCVCFACGRDTLRREVKST